MKSTSKKKKFDLERKIRQMTSAIKSEERSIDEAQAIDRAILLGIGDGLIVTDKQGSILLANDACAELLGMPRKEIIGRNILAVITSENESGIKYPDHERALLRTLKTGKKIKSTATKTHYYLRKDATRFPVSITATPVIYKKNIIGAVETFRDISLEKEIDLAKSEFVSLASHQLRTPLASVRWHLEDILTGELGALNQQQQKYIEQALQSCKRMIKLIRNLLNISRLEAGRVKVDPKPTDLIGLIESVIDEYQPLAKAKNCTIILRKPSFSVKKINIDATIVRQVATNLISNAAKYSSGRGKAGTITVTLEKKSPTIIINVHDTGIGIPAEVQHRVFEKFFRAKNVFKQETEGTGLGLYICRLLVEASGGTIWFTSKQNVGTTFSFSLPLAGSLPHSGEKKLE